MDLGQVKMDVARANDGVWVELGDGAEVLIAKRGNKQYLEYLRQLMKPHRRALESGKMDDNKLKEVIARAAARYVVLDWRGLTNGKDEQGNPIPFAYSEERAFELMSKDEFEPFQTFVNQHAGDPELFMAEFDEKK